MPKPLLIALHLTLICAILACDRPDAIATAIGKAAEEAGSNLMSTSELSINGADGLKLAATLYEGVGTQPRPGLLLLHMLGSQRSAWHHTAQRLAAAGYTTLALDLRGHGASDGPVDWARAPEDVLLAWHFLVDLPKVDGSKTALIGGSIGANLALVTAAESRINTIVLLSPGLNYAGVTTAEAMARYGNRPALLVASKEDTYAANSAQQLADVALGDMVRVDMLQGVGHGTNMLEGDPALTATIITWLGQRLIGTPLQVAEVRSLVVNERNGSYNFSVGIASPDLGCGQYADWWEVVSSEGELLYRRVLLHSHVDEQPFVRSGGPVDIGPEQEVWIRAHMFPQGYGGTAFFGSPRAGFRPAGLSPTFAPQTAQQEPLPKNCAF